MTETIDLMAALKASMAAKEKSRRDMALEISVILDDSDTAYQGGLRSTSEAFNTGWGECELYWSRRLRFYGEHGRWPDPETEAAERSERKTALRDAERRVLDEAVIWNRSRTSFSRGMAILVDAIDALEALRDA